MQIALCMLPRVVAFPAFSLGAAGNLSGPQYQAAEQDLALIMPTSSKWSLAVVHLPHQVPAPKARSKPRWAQQPLPPTPA